MLDLMPQATSDEALKDAGALDLKAFRSALGSFPIGVAIITTPSRNGGPVGLTCSSVSPRVNTIAGAGHTPQFSQPEKVLDKVSAFLDR